MLPLWGSYELARLLHEERIRAAKAPRPEWMYAAARPARLNYAAIVSRHLRISVAQALRHLAASVEPSGSNWQPSSQ